ncbi:MAG: hypothetical protein WA172_04245 [Terriglobales bacterium]
MSANEIYANDPQKKVCYEKHAQDLAAVIVARPFAAKSGRLAWIAIGFALSTNLAEYLAKEEAIMIAPNAMN